MHFMVRDPLSEPVWFLPLKEEELPRINELSNIPAIAQHFETIPPVSMEATRAMWSYIESGLMSLWGIHCNGRIIGGAGYYSQPPGTRLSHAATFFLYIEPAFQGMGIGTTAIQFLEKTAKERGFRRMECMVAGSNPRAISLYVKLGYEKEGEKKQAFFVNNSYENLILISKILSP